MTGVLLILLPLAFFPWTSDNFLIKSLLLSSYLIFFIPYSLFRGYRWGPVGYFIVIYLAFKALSLLWTPNINVGLDILWHESVIIFGGYFVGVHISNKYKNRLLKFVLVGAAGAAIYGLVQFAGIDMINWASNFSGRVSSFLGNPNFFSGYLLTDIPISVYFLMLSAGRKKFFYMGIVLILIFNLIVTGTRSSIFAFAVQLLILLILVKEKYIKIAVLSGGILAMFIIFSVSGLRERFIEGVTWTSSSISQRIFKWRTAAAMIKDSPLIGQGVGGVKTNYALYQGRVRSEYPIDLKGTSESQIHSEYLQVFAENGLFGFLIFGFIICYSIKNFLRRSGRETIFLLTALVGVLVDSIASFPLYIVPTGFLFFMYIGMEDKGTLKTLSPKVSVIISCVLFLLYIKYGVLAFYSDHLRWKADTLRNINPIKASEYYSRAHSHSPVDGQSEYRHGRLLYEIGDLTGAEMALKNAIKIRHYGEVYNNLGIVYYRQGDYINALKNWERAYEIGLPDEKDQETLKKNIQILKDRKKFAY